MRVSKDEQQQKGPPRSAFCKVGPNFAVRSGRLGRKPLNGERKRLVAGLKRHLAVRSIDIGECHLAEENGVLIHVADSLPAVAVDSEFDLRIPSVDRDDRKGNAVIGVRARKAADQRVLVRGRGGSLGEDRGLRPRLGNLPWCLKRKLERGLFPVAGGDRHITEGDEILADGTGAAFGMAVVRIFDLRRAAIDADDLDFNGPMSFRDRAFPVT